MVTLVELQQRQAAVRKRLGELPGQIQQATREQRRGAANAGAIEYQQLQAEEATLQLQIKQQQLEAAGASEFEQYRAGVTPGQIQRFSQQRTPVSDRGFLAAEQVRRQTRDKKTGELTGQPNYITPDTVTKLPGTIDRKKTSRELVPGQPTRLREERLPSLKRNKPLSSNLAGSVEPPTYSFAGLQGSRKTIEKFQTEYRKTTQKERARKGTQLSTLPGSIDQALVDVSGSKASSRFNKKYEEYINQIRLSEKAEKGIELFGTITRAELAIRSYDPFEPFSNLQRAGSKASREVIKKQFPNYPQPRPPVPDSPSSYTRAIIRGFAKFNQQNQQAGENLKPFRAKEIQKDLITATAVLEAGIQAIKKFEKKGLIRQVVTGPAIAALRTGQVVTTGTALAIGTSIEAAPELAVFVKGLSPFATPQDVFESAKKAKEFSTSGEFVGKSLLSKASNISKTTEQANTAFNVASAVLLKEAYKDFKQRPVSFVTEQLTYAYGPRILGKVGEVLELPFESNTFGRTKSKYRQIEQALIKEFGAESPQVKSYQAEFRRAFYDLPRRTEPKQAFTVEPTKAAQDLNIPKEAIEKINQKLAEYKAFTIGSLGFPEGPARIFSGDIDVQAVLPKSPKGSKNIYGKQLAEDILGILEEYKVQTPEGIKPTIAQIGPKPKQGGGLLRGETKYSVEFAKSVDGKKEVLYEFANIGESTGYFVKTQLPPIRRPFDTSLYDFLPTGNTGLRQGNIADQFRKAFEIGYLKGKPSDVIKRLKLVSEFEPKIALKDVDALKAFKAGEEQIGGKGASRLIDVKGYFRQTEKLFVNGKFVGKKVPIKDILVARLEESGPYQFARAKSGELVSRLFLGKRGQSVLPINLLVVPPRYQTLQGRANNYSGLLINLTKIKSTYETGRVRKANYYTGVPVTKYPSPPLPPRYPPARPPPKYPPVTPPKYPPSKPPTYPPYSPPKYPPVKPPSYPPGLPPTKTPPVVPPRIPPKPPRPPRPPPPERRIDLDRELKQPKKFKRVQLALLKRKSPPSLYGVAAGLTTTRKKLSKRLFTGLEARGVPTVRRRRK